MSNTIHRVALLYFTCLNKNVPLFEALKEHYLALNPKVDSEDQEIENKLFKEVNFPNLINFPDMEIRKQFVREIWKIVDILNAEEIKLEILRDRYFYLTKAELEEIIKEKDEVIMKGILKYRTQIKL